MELFLYVSLSTRICEEWQTVFLVSLVVLENKNSLIWPGQTSWRTSLDRRASERARVRARPLG